MDLGSRGCLRAMLVLLMMAAAASADARLLEDVYLREEPDRLVFGNERLTIRFSRASGRWESLRAAGVEQELIRPVSNPVDFRIEGQWMLERHQPRFLGHEVAFDRDATRVGLRLRFAVGEYELTSLYWLPAEQSFIERCATVSRAAGDGPAVKFEGFAFQAPGVLIGQAADCTIQAPGPFWPERFLRAGTPYESMKSRSMGFHSAPDAGFGLLCLANPKLGLALGSWMQTGGQVADHPSLRGDGQRISFRHHEQRAHWLRPAMSVRSDVHHIEIARGGVREVLGAFGAMASRQMPPLPNPPPWTREAIILEVYPAYFPAGFKGITRKLPFYRQIGFNVLYLMPHWKGGYSPIDLYAVDERYGSEQDLRELVRTAHELGMKVLFDMVIHGFNEKSPVVQQRPELFCRTDKGELARHPAWKSITTDWASPAYQRYMVELVLHDLKTYDIDGYRVDAATYKGANWDPKSRYPAYRGGSAAPELIGKMLAAMRKTKPEAAMLSEVFGPLFYTVCDLVHDNQTEAPQWVLEQMDKGLMTAADYKAHLSAVYAALPAGAARVMFARNHDTSWFYHFNGYTPRFMAMEAVHAFFGTPEVFAGDPRHGPHPDDGAVYEHYRKLFAARRRFPELARGEVLLDAVMCDNPMVFAGLRRLKESAVLAVISFSDRPQQVELRLSGMKQSGGRRITLVSPLTGARQDVTVASDGACKVELGVYDVWVGGL